MIDHNFLWLFYRYWLIKTEFYWCLVNWIIQFLNPFCHFLLLLNLWWNFLIGLFFLISSSRLTVASGFPNFFFRSSMIELSSWGGPTRPNLSFLFLRVSSSSAEPAIANFCFLFYKVSLSSTCPAPPNFFNLYCFI